MSKHTPGPWKVVSVLLPGEQSSVPGVVSESGVCLSSQVTMDNAHLIAAAPEMLDKLKIVLGYGLGPEMRKAIENTIAKAEGR